MREDETDIEENESADSAPLLGAGASTHEFFVLNISSKPLHGKVSWLAGGNEVSINVNGLAPCSISKREMFAPMAMHRDLWRYSGKGRKYQLNCKASDRYAVVVISDYGLSVLVTGTSPDTWKW